MGCMSTRIRTESHTFKDFGSPFTDGVNNFCGPVAKGSMPPAPINMGTGCPDSPAAIDHFLQAADDALYRAKAAGRDQILLRTL